MTGSIVQLFGTEIGALRQQEDDLIVEFPALYIIRSEGIPGVDAGTRWRQAAELILSDAQLDRGAAVSLPASVRGGKLRVNQFAYVDMWPLPLECHGSVVLELALEGSGDDIRISAQHAKLNLFGDPHYIEHLQGMGRS